MSKKTPPAKPARKLVGKTVKDPFGRDVRLLFYASGAIRVRVNGAAPMHLAEAFLTGFGQNVIVKLDPVGLPFDPEEVIEGFIEDLGVRLIDGDNPVNSAAAQTNAFAYGVDDHEILNFSYDATEGVLSATIRLHYSGEQDKDSVFCGSEINAIVECSMKLEDDGTWILEKHEVKSAKTDFEDESWSK